MQTWFRGAVGAALLVMIAAAPAGAAVRPGVLERVSVSSSGEGANDVSNNPQLSHDGRFVVFASAASNLVEGDTVGLDIFVRDLLRQTTERVSLSASGEELPAGAEAPSISADGRYVIFTTRSAAVPEDDDGGFADVYRRDRLLRTTELVTVAADGSQIRSSASTSGGRTQLSADGQRIVFLSGGSDVVPGVAPPQLRDTNRTGTHAYLRDMAAGTTRLMSARSDGTPGDFSTQNPTISGDGEKVAFETQAMLIPGNGDTADIDSYMKDVDSGTVIQLGLADGAEQPDRETWRVQLDHTGAFAVFDSVASNLVPRDQGGVSFEAFLRDVSRARTTKVNVTAAGLYVGDTAYRPAPSGDGRRIAFWSRDPLATESGSEFATDVYLHDRDTGSTELVSVGNDGQRGNGIDQVPSISADGSTIAWLSSSSNFVPGDDNDEYDIYVRRIGPDVGVAGPLRSQRDGDTLTLSGLARFGGAVLARGLDPQGDTTAPEVTGDLIRADLAIRHEERDQLFGRLLASELVELSGIPGAPGTVYGMAFTVDGVPYEVRTMGGELVREPEFQLWNCAVACVLQETVRGSYGTAGSEVRFALPLSSVGAEAGSRITAARAFFSAGTVAAHEWLDEVTLPDATVPGTSVRVGLGDAATPVEVDAGRFTGTVDLAGLRPGRHDVLARVCSGTRCGESSVPVEVERLASSLALALATAGPVVTLRATLTDQAGDPLEGATMTFADGTSALGEAVTDATGAAVLTVRRSRLKSGSVVTARFAGTDDHLPSSAEQTYKP